MFQTTNQINMIKHMNIKNQRIYGNHQKGRKANPIQNIVT
jgi:hypothetical protein